MTARYLRTPAQERERVLTLLRDRILDAEMDGETGKAALWRQHRAAAKARALPIRPAGPPEAP